MRYDFWKSKWKEARIGFHRDSVNPNLESHWNALKQRLPGAGKPRVLVPLCGKTLDMAWLVAHGCEVCGVEFVESAAVDYFAEQAAVAQRREVDGMPHYEGESIRIICGDFFAVKPSPLLQADVVYDRAALVAIEPARRREYAAKLHALCNPEAGLLLVTFEHDLESGPPFSIDDVPSIFSEHFQLEQVERKDILDEEPAFRDRDASYLREVIWYGRRL